MQKPRHNVVQVAKSNRRYGPFTDPYGVVDWWQKDDKGRYYVWIAVSNEVVYLHTHQFTVLED